MSKTDQDEIIQIFAPLGIELAVDIIKHRKGLKCPLTPRGAKGLMKEYQLTGDPIAAAEYHLNMGWRGFESGWMKRQQQPRQNSIQAPRKPGNMADFTRDLMDQFYERTAPIQTTGGRSIEHFVEDAPGQFNRPAWDA